MHGATAAGFVSSWRVSSVGFRSVRGDGRLDDGAIHPGGDSDSAAARTHARESQFPKSRWDGANAVAMQVMGNTIARNRAMSTEFFGKPFRLGIKP